MSDLTFVTVQMGDFCGRGREYLEKLVASVERHTTVPHRWAVLTDDPDGVPAGVAAIEAHPEALGHWQKMYLFAPEVLPSGRILFMDLDTVIVGDLDALANYEGPFAMLTDFIRGTPSSAIMAWESGYAPEVWFNWIEGRCPKGVIQRQGDQDWIWRGAPDEPVRLQDRFSGIYACFAPPISQNVLEVPEDAVVVNFWAPRRPHQVDWPWVAEHWRT